MKEDPPSSQRSLMDRLTQVFNDNEPKDRQGLLDTLEDASKRGLVESDALKMIQGVFQVADMQVRDIMIPRTQMVVLDAEKPASDALNIIIESGHSRFPVVEDENRNEVLGVLLAKDLIKYLQEGDIDTCPLRDIVRTAVFTPESKRLNVLLSEFKSQRNHMAIVIDEYGDAAGLVTIEDVLEQIVGDIDDEHDTDEDDDIRESGDGRYTIRALTPIEEVNEKLKARYSDEQFDTIGGLVMQGIGHMPQVGECVVLGDFLFKVLEADSRRIHLLQAVVADNIQSVDDF